MKNSKLIKAVKYVSDSDYRFLVNAIKFKRYDSMNDEEYLKRMFKARMKTELDLKHPKTFNEKLQWLKLYNHKPEYTTMVDKYKVRDYIKEKIGEEYLIPLLGVWDKPDEIDFDKLPDQFVLKCNHNSSTGMYICKDKSQIDITKVKSGLKKGIQEDYYLIWREWPYKNVPRKIIAEKYMVDESGTELKDYKIFCFNGVPQLIKVDYDRFTDHNRNLYDIHWNRMPCTFFNKKNWGREISKPESLDKMLELAGILSKNIPFVRIDFYSINGHVYFGEITFFHESGFEKFTPSEWDNKLGNLILLPK